MAQIDDVLLFARVVDSGSFTGVAAERDTCSSLISKRVKQLQDRLGVRLLNRTTCSLSVTESGSIYYGYCASVRDTLEEAEQRVVALSEQPRGRLKIDVSLTFGKAFMAPLLRDSLQRHRGLEVAMYVNERYPHRHNVSAKVEAFMGV